MNQESNDNKESDNWNDNKELGTSIDKRKKPTIFKKIADFFYVMRPIMLSHHPICEEYNDHSFRMFGRDFCIGCFIGYPSAIIALIIGYLSGLFFLFNGTILLLIGIVFNLSYLLSIFGLTKRKPIKIVSKILIGIGSAFVIAAIMTIPLLIYLRLFIVLIFTQIVTAIMGLKRQKEMNKICNACEYQNNRNICPGMGVIQQNMKRLGFIDRKKPLSEQNNLENSVKN
jgi:hypothetical protein